MASTVRANWTTWVAGSQTDDPRIGVNGGKNNIMRYQFTTGASGASHIYFKMGYTRLFDGSYIDICWYVGTSSTSHTNANKAQGSASHGTVTFDSNHHSFTLDSDINLSPNTTYYLWLFPAVTTHGFYSGSRADADNDLTLSGATKYTISYNSNGGTGAPSAQTKTHGTALTLSSTKPTRATTTNATYTVTYNANGGSCSTASATAKKTTSYTFKNWNTNSGGTGTAYSAGGSYTANAAATLYAQWNSSTTTASVTLPTASRSNATVTGFKVTFNANGGTCSTTSLTSNRTASYTFKGWSTSSTATSGSTGSYTPTASVTLYAAWTTSYTNKSITLPTPTRTGYTFKGWATSSTATSGTTGSYTPTAAITLYATWSANSITFEYYSNNGAQTKFVTWTASASGTWPNNHHNYTSGTYKQAYTGHTATGYYGTTPDGGILVGEDESFASYAAICQKYGVSINTASTTISIYCQWGKSGAVYIHNGSTYETYQIYIHNGSTWEQYVPYIHNGTEWELYG